MMGRRFLVLTGLAVGLAMVGFSLLVWNQSQTGGEDAAYQVARGGEIYAAECASCHGEALEGAANWRVPNADGTLPPPPHDDSGHTWHHPDGMLFAYTKDGGEAALRVMGVTGFQSAMPGFGDRLSDRDIWDVLAFIKASWSDKAREHQAKLTLKDQGS